MPTIQSTTLGRRVVSTVDLAEREVKAQRFGRSTRVALKAFQVQQSLPATGRVEDATATRLNEVLTTRGFFPPKRRPFQDRQFLRIKLREGDRLDEEVCQRM